MSGEEKVDADVVGDSVSKTDDEKVGETDSLKSGARTDDQKMEGQASPEPEYTPPDSAASWSTMDELNGGANKPPADDNDTAMTGENKDNSDTMTETDTKPSEEATNQATDETTNKPTTEETTEADSTPTETSDKTDAPDTAPEVTPDQTVDDGSKSEEPTDAPAGDKKDDDAAPAETQETVTEAPEPTPEAAESKESEEKADKAEDEASKREKEAEVAKAQEETLIAKEKLDKTIQKNEQLQDELKSALSNQETEAEAYKKLTEENARLHKHYTDMKEKHDEMEGGHTLLMAELESLRKVNSDQRDDIRRLETEIKFLKETQGGDDAVRGLQDKLIRLSNEQEEKDKKIHSLEGQLDAANEKLKNAESNAARSGNNEDPPKSKTCIVM